MSPEPSPFKPTMAGKKIKKAGVLRTSRYTSYPARASTVQLSAFSSQRFRTGLSAMAVCFHYDKNTTLRVLIYVVKCCFALQHCPVDYLVLAAAVNPLEISNEQ